MLAIAIVLGFVIAILALIVILIAVMNRQRVQSYQRDGKRTHAEVVGLFSEMAGAHGEKQEFHYAKVKFLDPRLNETIFVNIPCDYKLNQSVQVGQNVPIYYKRFNKNGNDSYKAIFDDENQEEPRNSVNIRQILFAMLGFVFILIAMFFVVTLIGGTSMWK